MELLILVIILGGLAFLSLRYGYDSSAIPYSKEHEHARLGMLWDVHTLHLADLRREAWQWQMQQRANPAPRGLRRRLAGRLRAFALWLNPELAAAYRVEIKHIDLLQNGLPSKL